jgi:hypothetical protein
MIKWSLIFLLCLPASGFSECLILRDGYAIPDITRAAQSMENVYFYQGQRDEVWKLDLNYVDRIVDQEPSDMQKLQLPGFSDKSEIEVATKRERMEIQTPNAVVGDMRTINPYEASVVYQQHEKHPLASFGLACVLPSAGHFYAGDWGRGLLFFAGEILAAVASGLVISQMNSDSRNLPAAYAVAVVPWGGVKIFEMMDAVNLTHAYNHTLKQNLRIQMHSSATEIGLNLTCAF